MVVGQTHLKAKPAFMRDRVEQCNMIKDFFDKNYRDIPCFMAGDFNEEPQNEPIKIMKQSFVDLYSTIDNDTEEHPQFTTWKFREKDGGWVRHTIDYIFIAKNDWYNKRDTGCTVIEYMDPIDVEKEG